MTSVQKENSYPFYGGGSIVVYYFFIVPPRPPSPPLFCYVVLSVLLVLQSSCCGIESWLLCLNGILGQVWYLIVSIPDLSFFPTLIVFLLLTYGGQCSLSDPPSIMG